MRSVKICAAAAMLAASAGFAVAQPAPENRPSTAMQPSGRTVKMNSHTRFQSGRSVAGPTMRAHGAVKSGVSANGPKSKLTGKSNKSSGQ